MSLEDTYKKMKLDEAAASRTRDQVADVPVKGETKETVDQASKPGDTHKNRKLDKKGEQPANGEKPTETDMGAGKQPDLTSPHTVDESEQLDELSPKTLGSYIRKSAANMGSINRKMIDNTRDDDEIRRLNALDTKEKRKITDKLGKDYDKLLTKRSNRGMGIKRASEKLTKKAMGEELEFDLDQDLLESVSFILEHEDFIESIQNLSDDEIFEAFVDVLSHDDSLNESVLNELSPKTLGSYIKKASDDLTNNAYNAGKGMSTIDKVADRNKGIKKATDKITKKAMGEEFEEKIQEAAVFSLTDELGSLLESEGLNDEFKTKAVGIFVAAVNEATSKHLEGLNESAANLMLEEVEAYKAELDEQVEKYLDHVIKEWVEDNKVELQSQARNQVAESFMEGLKDLLEQHYIELPADKEDMFENQVRINEELEEQLNEQAELNIELRAQLTEAEKTIVLESFCSDLTQVEAEKVRSLAEGIDFDNVDSFHKKLGTLKENYFPDQKAGDSNLIIEDAEGEVDAHKEELKENIDPEMSQYLSTLSKMNVRK